MSGPSDLRRDMLQNAYLEYIEKLPKPRNIETNTQVENGQRTSADVHHGRCADGQHATRGAEMEASH